MRLLHMIAATALLAAAPLATAAAQVAYQIDLTTAYGYSNPFTSATFLGNGSPGPDTSFVQIANNGTSTFTGHIVLKAVANGGTSASAKFTKLTIAPGTAVSFAVGDEASNQGGFNLNRKGTENGAGILIQGKVTDGGGNSMAIRVGAYDKDIHSGNPRTAPCDNISTDAYVLQGGSVTGCDNEDDYETSQSYGSISFTN